MIAGFDDVMHDEHERLLARGRYLIAHPEDIEEGSPDQDRAAVLDHELARTRHEFRERTRSLLYNSGVERPTDEQLDTIVDPVIDAWRINLLPIYESIP